MFLPPSCLVVSQEGNEQNLIKALARHVKVMDGVALLNEVVFPLVRTGQYWNRFQEFMLSVLDNFQYVSLLNNTLKCLPFIQTSLNKYAPPSQLYDPDIKELKAIFSDDLFPGPTYNKYLPALHA